MKGRISSLARDWATSRFLVTLELDDAEVESIEKLKGRELSVELKVFRRKRSLDSNAYAWVLLQKMAEALGSTKEEVYLFCLQRYSRSFDTVLVSEEALDRFRREWRTIVDLGEVYDGMHQVQCYYGSHTFDTKEMSVFIDGIVSECKELGIETMPPEELERMLKSWNR